MQIDAQANLRTLRDVLRYAVTRFSEGHVFYGHGQIDAFDEAVFLILRGLKLPVERLDVFLDAYLTHAEINTLLEMIERRVKKRVPSAYLLNEAWLHGYRFYVDERTIIPRSFIAELLKDGLEPWVQDPAAVRDVLDLCTGSGCLGIMAADVFPVARVDAVDVSDDALLVAKRNVEDYQLQERLTLRKSDLFESLPKKKYDLIITNPPYVTDAAMSALPREYSYEPKLALAGGTDGLDIVARILRDSRDRLKRNGTLIVEIGDGRPAFESRFASIAPTWLTTSAGDDMVFMLRQDQLP
jgi:ribosomal protein L3 glutamine methyltransferase